MKRQYKYIIINNYLHESSDNLKYKLFLQCMDSDL